ncbi:MULTISPECIES: SDR family NAD(P)-dependent oxidoreductase [Mycolicibacterium]|uniref:SDR family NAD(P)-dependent oxidoreductase n=1 Tax=Mycolicibacterium TaxID=1866885 RepID=UPI0008DE308F|nr:SDR family NAD(P)-dependent oxidoreductase [Mycolicibacterium llatzerense]
MQNAVLITGANSGIGRETARQLAVRGNYSAIYLACRNRVKAQRARSELQALTGYTRFITVDFDAANPESARRLVQALDNPLHGVLLNAGGTGGNMPFQRTDTGMTRIFADNIGGHAALLAALIDSGALLNTGVLAGSEAARGVPALRIPRPAFQQHSVDEYAAVIDGSFFEGRARNPLHAYAYVKFLGAAWMAASARRHPNLRLLTMSPGNTSGTAALDHTGLLARTLGARFVFPYVAPLFGLAHPLPAGGERMVKALTNPELKTGLFYASHAKTLTGPVTNQEYIYPALGNLRYQDHALQAVEQFLA